ncbi:Helicase conserved C-terminal domain [Rhizoctonia solani]|uniref:Helicase conserved C-terminal domain n=1 Tax=Rhizoctonia solani TaxID=456999 RepID=A0A8H8SSI7_9AGAM|nr:Helicase conserved C-terminal domain [Rhizoctonia solani]QRW16049.1 Helicase conserved C-terminal domain [Rhizoctonia solani]
MSAHLSEGPRLKRRRLSESSEAISEASSSSHAGSSDASDSDTGIDSGRTKRSVHPYHTKFALISLPPDCNVRPLDSEAISEASSSSHAGSSDASDSDTGIDSGRTKRSVHPELSDSEDDAPKLQFKFDTAPNRVTKTNRTQLARQPPAPKDVTFGSLGVKPSLVTSLEAMSIRRPTPVSDRMSAAGTIGNAKTGSGKTMAFAIPILQKLSEDPYGIYALELAFQISEHGDRRWNGHDGTSARAGKETHVVVATPGRLVDHMDSNGSEWSLSRLKFLVLDEADRLLTDTFAEDLAKILSKTPKDRQTCLFTATHGHRQSRALPMPPSARETDAVCIQTDSVETVGTLKQHYLLVPSHVREPYLFYALCNPPESIAHMRVAAPEPQEPSHKSKKPPPTIIFVSKPKTAAYLAKLLQTLGIRATALHSRLKQRERLNSLNLFRSRVVPVLISTDVGARGLDIADVALVVNWDFPGAPEEYTHRVGRTARAGRNGMAISFVTERDEERYTRSKRGLVSTEEKVLEGLNAVSTAKRIANMTAEVHEAISPYNNRGTNEADNTRRTSNRHQALTNTLTSSLALVQARMHARKVAHAGSFSHRIIRETDKGVLGKKVVQSVRNVNVQDIKAEGFTYGDTR